MDSKQPTKIYPGMWRLPTNPERCCIYRVPNCLRDINPEAYTPQLVLIGPLRHSLKSQARKSLELGNDITYTKSMGYLKMEELKKFYLAEFVKRARRGEEIIDGFRRMIEKDEKEIRESYSESTAWIESQEFVEMILHDAVFIIEFILRATEIGAEKIGDPLMDGSLENIVDTDLMLLENQLPCFILDQLFDPFVPSMSQHQHQTCRELIIAHFEFQGKIKKKSEFKHITDMFRCVRVEETLPQRYEGECKTIEHMYNADKLDYCGIKFKVIKEKLLLRVSFEHGCLEMPCLTVDDQLETTLRNVMALEQCHYTFNAHVCNYVIFLDYLIDADKDVDLLVEKGIIKNWIGQPALVAQMVNRLGLGVSEVGSHYSAIADNVNKHCENRFNKSRARLKRVYFGDLWTGTATIAATLLLFMTLAQTVFSLIQFLQNAS